MKRRNFLQAAAVAALPLGRGSSFADDANNRPRRAMTVEGEVDADELGKMLPHEHILVDFVGADQISPDRYDADEAFRVMLPFVRQAKESGCETIAECTPAYLGRDPELLRRLSKATGKAFAIDSTKM